MINWSYYDKFEGIMDKYLPTIGEGESKATQIVTAVNKLIYKWYNDGDVFDNTRHLSGWLNNLSSYANWLYKYTGCVELEAVWEAKDDDDYEYILKDLADAYLDEGYLKAMDRWAKVGSIYDCDGPFKFVECDEEEREEW